MLVTATTAESDVTLFYIDLNKYKPVTSILGHEIDDQLLIQVSESIRGQ